MMAVGGFAVAALDFVGVWIMFHPSTRSGGWSLSEIAFLYGATGFGLAAGRPRRRPHRAARPDDPHAVELDAMFPGRSTADQVCADEFALRRFARIVQAVVVLGIARRASSWSPDKVLVALAMWCPRR